MRPPLWLARCALCCGADFAMRCCLDGTKPAQFLAAPSFTVMSPSVTRGWGWGKNPRGAVATRGFAIPPVSTALPSIVHISMAKAGLNFSVLVFLYRYYADGFFLSAYIFLLSLVVCFERRINKNYFEFCASEIQPLCTGHGRCFGNTGTQFMSLFDPPRTNIILRVGLDRRCKKALSTWLWLFLFLQFILSKCSVLRLMFCYCQELTLQTSLLDHLYSLKLLHGDKKWKVWISIVAF